MRLIDTHCHLTHSRLRPQIAAVLERARQAGVTAIVCAAADLAESREAMGLAGRESDVYCLAGVHPHEAKSAAEGYLSQIEQLAVDPKNVAIGEIGLDYHYDFSPRDVQRRVFAEQLDLARRIGKPVVIHTREAFDDTISLLKSSGADGRRVVFHSFTEGSAAATAVLDLGAMISFSGIVTFRSAGDIQAAAAFVPDDRLLIETDAPFLSPEPVRSMKVNEPANVAHVATFLAALRHSTPEAVADLAATSAERFFGIP